MRRNIVVDFGRIWFFGPGIFSHLRFPPVTCISINLSLCCHIFHFVSEVVVPSYFVSGLKYTVHTGKAASLPPLLLCSLLSLHIHVIRYVH